MGGVRGSMSMDSLLAYDHFHFLRYVMLGMLCYVVLPWQRHIGIKSILCFNQGYKLFVYQITSKSVY